MPIYYLFPLLIYWKKEDQRQYHNRIESNGTISEIFVCWIKIDEFLRALVKFITAFISTHDFSKEKHTNGKKRLDISDKYMIDKYHFLLFRIVKSYAPSFSFGFELVSVHSLPLPRSHSLLASSSLRHSQHVSIWNTIMAIMHFKYLFINKWLFTLSIIYTASYRRAGEHAYARISTCSDCRVQTHTRSKANTRTKSCRILFDWMNGWAFILVQRTPCTWQLTHHSKSQKKNGTHYEIWLNSMLFCISHYWYKLSCARVAVNFLQVYCTHIFICVFKWRLFLINTYCMQQKKNKIAELEKNPERCWRWCTNKF